MEKQNQIFDELRVIFSQERLDGYLDHAHCNNSKNEALIAYSWNIELSQALYPALQILEIALRNSLHDSITESYQTERWFELPFLHDREKQQVHQAYGQSFLSPLFLSYQKGKELVPFYHAN